MRLGDGEFITAVDVRHGNLIDQLKFYTNLRKMYGPFGGRGGKLAQERPPIPNPCLAWVKGSVVRVPGTLCLKELQFGWIEIDPSSQVRLNTSLSVLVV